MLWIVATIVFAVVVAGAIVARRRPPETLPATGREEESIGDLLRGASSRFGAGAALVVIPLSPTITTALLPSDSGFILPPELFPRANATP